jgi:hypothetical protein
MSHYPCNAGVKQWGGPWAGEFIPAGPLDVLGSTDLGEIVDTYKKTISGRIIVGFNVGLTPRWTINDLIPIVREVRMQQTSDPGATFLLQQGLYRHSEGKLKGKIAEETGAQVIIINLSGASQREFEDQMVQLAEIIAARLHQETVIVDIQVNGIIKKTHVVKP